MKKIKWLKWLLIILIICVVFVVTDTVAKKELAAKDCKCSIIVECYYPGYQSGVDLPFASKVVDSCAKAQEYMKYISQTSAEVEVFFYLHPES